MQFIGAPTILYLQLLMLLYRVSKLALENWKFKQILRGSYLKSKISYMACVGFKRNWTISVLGFT